MCLVVIEELFPFVFYSFRSRRLRRRAAAEDLVNEEPYASYSVLTEEQLSTRLAEERERATALDDKTFKMTFSLSIGLTLVSTTSAVLLSISGPSWITRLLAWLVWFAVFYILTGGGIALEALRTERSYGYGTEPLLRRPAAERRTFLADCLPRQEVMNQIRQVRNEASYQSLRNGFVLLLVALLVFIASKLLGANPVIVSPGDGPG